MNENQIHFARLCDKVTCNGQFTDVQRGHWNNYDILYLYTSSAHTFLSMATGSKTHVTWHKNLITHYILPQYLKLMPFTFCCLEPDDPYYTIIYNY